MSRPLRVLVAWRPKSAKSGRELANTVAWLAAHQNIQVRTATVISQTWPQPEDEKAVGLGNLGLNPNPANEPKTAITPTSSPNEVIQHGLKEWFAAESEAAAREASAMLRAAGVPREMIDPDRPNVVVTHHSETSQLIAAAEEFEADVMLLGSRRGDTPRGRFGIGATANALLHGSPIPLLLVPRSYRPSKHGPTRVNCAYVDTPQSQQALRHAADLAKRWDVPLRLVAFSPDGATMYPSQVPLHTITTAGKELTDRSVAKAWKKQAKKLLERGRDRALARHPELQVQTKTGVGDGWKESVEDTGWKRGDLLVLGSSVLGDFNTVFIGPSTNQILRHIPVPVFMSTV